MKLVVGKRSWWLAVVAAVAAWAVAPGVSAAGGGWKAVGGSLAQISVGSARHVWGVNSRGAIYKWTGRGWQGVPGGLRQVSVAADGTVWGVNRGGAIFRYKGPRGRGSPWDRMPGNLLQISVGSARHVWGVARGDSILRWTGRGWQKVGGRLSQVSVGADGTVWGVNRAGSIYRYTGRGGPSPWKFVPGRLASISVGNARQIRGVAPGGAVYRFTGRGWQREAGVFKQTSIAADGTLWGVTARGQIQRWDAASAARLLIQVARLTKTPSRGSPRAPSGGGSWGRVGGKRRGLALKLMPIQARILGGFGQLQPMGWVIAKLKKLEDQGKAAPGNPLILAYERWKEEVKKAKEKGRPAPLPPGHLGHSDKGFKLFNSGYRKTLLDDLKKYVPFIAGKVFAAHKKWTGYWTQRRKEDNELLATEMLFFYGCKRISELMPGFARVIRKRVIDEVETVQNWTAPIPQSALPKKPGGKMAGKRPKLLKKRPRIVEVCTVTHKQLGETLRKDLDHLVRQVRPQRLGSPRCGGGADEPLCALSESGPNSGTSAYFTKAATISIEQNLTKKEKDAWKRRVHSIRNEMWTDLGRYDPSLKGQTFHDIAKRLMGFYRKGGEARNFEQALRESGPEVKKMGSRVVRDAPAPAKRDDDGKKDDSLEHQGKGHTIDTRNNREVLRRRVEQWTYGYEYDRLSKHLTWVSRKASRAPMGGGSWGMAGGKRTVHRPVNYAKLLKDYRSAERGLLTDFWRSCDEIQTICQQPRTRKEVRACIQCAQQFVRYRCVEGTKEDGITCRGQHRASAPVIERRGSILIQRTISTLQRRLGNRFLNWLGVEFLAEMVRGYHWGTSDQATLEREVIRDLVARRFLPDKVDPTQGKDKQGLKYLDALPITAWQRCALFNPYYVEKRDVSRCSLDKVRQQGSSAHWEKALLFRQVIQEDFQVRSYLKNFADYERKTCGQCIGQRRKVRDRANKFFKRGKYAADDRNKHLRDAGGAIGGVLGPIIGKILAMLLKAAGMYETMKTLAKAAGLTPAQAVDCEDPEYRQDIMKLDPKKYGKRDCLLKVFAKNFTNVLESVIIMLGNQLVDWGVDLLRAVLQGVKSALISAAGSVPFAGGFLAMLVDLGWELIMNFGAKALLKGFVVSKLPEWLKVRKLADLPWKAVISHPIVQVVAGLVLELVEAAMRYGDKGPLAVGIDVAINTLLWALRSAKRPQYFWIRAVTFAKRELAKIGDTSQSVSEQLVVLAKSMIRGIAQVLARRLESPWRERVLNLVDELGNLSTSGITSLLSNPKNLFDKITGLVKTKLGPLVLPIVSSMLPLPDWTKGLLSKAGEHIYNLVTRSGAAPTAQDLLKMVVAPLPAVWKRISFGDPGLAAVGKQVSSGIDWAIENLGKLKSEYLDKPWNIAKAVFGLVDTYVRQKAGDLIDKMKEWSSALKPQAVQASVKALLSRGLNAVARVLATTARGVAGGKKLSAGELLVKLAQATKSVSDAPLTLPDWKKLASGGGGLLLVHLVKELVGHMLSSGPAGKFIRGLLDGVGFLLADTSKLTGVGIKHAVGQFLQNLHATVSSFCSKTLVEPLTGTARTIVAALVDGGLGLLKGNASGLRQLIDKAKAGAGQLLGRAKALLGSVIRSLVSAAKSKLSTLGTILEAAVKGALGSWK